MCIYYSDGIFQVYIYIHTYFTKYVKAFGLGVLSIRFCKEAWMCVYI